MDLPETPFPGPEAARHFVLGDGETGWACGLGGGSSRLRTTATRELRHPSRPTYSDGFAKPAVPLVVALPERSTRLLTGKYFLNYTLDGAQSWLPVELYSDSSLAAGYSPRSHPEAVEFSSSG